MNKMNIKKRHFCIYFGYLCLVLEFDWWADKCKCDKYEKKEEEKTKKGPNSLLSTALYVRSRTDDNVWKTMLNYSRQHETSCIKQVCWQQLFMSRKQEEV